MCMHVYIIQQSAFTLNVCLSVATSVRNAAFGQGSGPIHLDNVFCHGHELFLINCSYSLPSPSSDFHFEDAGVTCYNTSQL